MTGFTGSCCGHHYTTPGDWQAHMKTHRGSKHPRAGRDHPAPVKPTLRPQRLTAAEQEWLGAWVTDPDTGATGQVWRLGDRPTVWIAATNPHGSPNHLVSANTQSLQLVPHRHDGTAVDEPLPSVAA